MHTKYEVTYSLQQVVLEINSGQPYALKNSSSSTQDPLTTPSLLMYCLG